MPDACRTGAGQQQRPNRQRTLIDQNKRSGGKQENIHMTADLRMDDCDLSLRFWEEVLQMITPSLRNNKCDLADLAFITNIVP